MNNIVEIIEQDLKSPDSIKKFNTLIKQWFINNKIVLESPIPSIDPNFSLTIDAIETQLPFNINDYPTVGDFLLQKTNEPYPLMSHFVDFSLLDYKYTLIDAIDTHISMIIEDYKNNHPKIKILKKHDEEIANLKNQLITDIEAQNFTSILKSIPLQNQLHYWSKGLAILDQIKERDDLYISIQTTRQTATFGFDDHWEYIDAFIENVVYKIDPITSQEADARVVVTIRQFPKQKKSADIAKNVGAFLFSPSEIYPISGEQFKQIAQDLNPKIYQDNNVIYWDFEDLCDYLSIELDE